MDRTIVSQSRLADDGRVVLLNLTEAVVYFWCGVEGSEEWHFAFYQQFGSRKLALSFPCCRLLFVRKPRVCLLFFFPLSPYNLRSGGVRPDPMANRIVPLPSFAKRRIDPIRDRQRFAWWSLTVSPLPQKTLATPCPCPLFLLAQKFAKNLILMIFHHFFYRS